VNETKTEEYTIKRKGEDAWKKCKHLGSLLDTENDINRRKSLATNTFNQLKPIFTNKKVSDEVKLRLFNSHIRSIFMYNSELWTLTKQLENTIDTFQRNILRNILGLKWYDKVKNEDLYSKTKEIPWSKVIKKRRLTWYGHLLRLPERTAAKAALREIRKYHPKPRGGQKLTWIKQVDKEMKENKIKLLINGKIIEDHQTLAQNRHIWRAVVTALCQ